MTVQNFSCSQCLWCSIPSPCSSQVPRLSQLWLKTHVLHFLFNVMLVPEKHSIIVLWLYQENILCLLFHKHTHSSVLNSFDTLRERLREQVLVEWVAVVSVVA